MKNLKNKLLIKGLMYDAVGMATMAIPLVGPFLDLAWAPFAAKKMSEMYPGKKGNYKENDSLLPINNYAWSKLGGEASVQLYKNSLILRLCMTEKPFVHKKAFANVKTSFIYHEDVVPIILKVLDKKGTLNIGGKERSIFNFAKSNNKKLKKVYLKKSQKIGIPFNSSMNLRKMKFFLKKSTNN